MNRLLVLGQPSRAASWGRRLRRLLSTSRACEGRVAGFDAVLVINDQSPESLDYLRQAIALKRTRPELAVALLSFLEPEAQVAAPEPPPAPASWQPESSAMNPDFATMLASSHPELTVDLRAGVLTFEYSGTAAKAP